MIMIEICVTSEAGAAHPSGAPVVFSGVRATQSLVFCVVFCKSLFVICLLVIVLSFGHCVVFLRTLPFGIFKLFLLNVAFMSGECHYSLDLVNDRYMFAFTNKQLQTSESGYW